MKHLLTLLLALTILSCDSDRKQWIMVKQNPRFSNLFKFSYNSRDSKYLDSAINIMNDSLAIDKNFWLRYHDDTIDMIKINFSYAYKIAKSSVIFYNTRLNELTYIDSIYNTQHSIDSVITKFIEKIEWGGFYIFSDTLENKNDWLTLFSTIDKVKFAYQTARENYAFTKYGLEFRNLDQEQKTFIISKIRMPIAIYFRYPFPREPSENDPKPTYTIPVSLDTIKNQS